MFRAKKEFRARSFRVFAFRGNSSPFISLFLFPARAILTQKRELFSVQIEEKKRLHNSNSTNFQSTCERNTARRRRLKKDAFIGKQNKRFADTETSERERVKKAGARTFLQKVVFTFVRKFRGGNRRIDELGNLRIFLLFFRSGHLAGAVGFFRSQKYN